MKLTRSIFFQATLLAMRQAVAGLAVAPDFVLVDGNRCHLLLMLSQAVAVVKGDSRVVEISSASIIGKVTRDRKMAALHQQLSKYSFAQHKWYPIAFHLEKLVLHGATMHRRRSFALVRWVRARAGMNLALSRGAIVAPTLHVG